MHQKNDQCSQEKLLHVHIRKSHVWWNAMAWSVSIICRMETVMKVWQQSPGTCHPADRASAVTTSSTGQSSISFLPLHLNAPPPLFFFFRPCMPERFTVEWAIRMQSQQAQILEWFWGRRGRHQNAQRVQGLDFPVPPYLAGSPLQSRHILQCHIELRGKLRLQSVLQIAQHPDVEPVTF